MVVNYSDLKDRAPYEFSELQPLNGTEATFVLPLTVCRRKPDHMRGGKIPRSLRVTAIGTRGVHTIAFQYTHLIIL